ncbi:D-alanyl-D-alanine carboxypeptidase (penicillin-binding protein 5/6) [Rhizobium sp. RU35A]|uniref:D-alanyl-D-alanine carboxypeptidase n=1 Tax=Rhizobium sp. RU35A TaxID=1907414 RepID=UPI0009574811|nr:D-alanyl-D-alanine carboxypeptidase [Rhizobium sp. RU35A]SIP95932.1 D-alanyl-D-alanine carboxypeptidase (penicillin-binding protein 5/6) [Rhizobium sp. RU35A]
MTKIAQAFSILMGMAALLLGLAAAPAQAGYAHFVMDANTGRVLAAENADALNHPASLTKMMTLYMTFEALRDGRLSWDQKIVMSRNGASTIPFKLGIPAGQTYTVREAVYGMAVKSANDVAEGIGDHLYGSEEKFGQAMTRKARQLGMSRTTFRNGSGLPDSRQVTTARDMATLGLALMRDFPKEYRIFATRSFTFRGRTISGHNHLMYRYRGMDGIKTGYINASGFNIVSAVNEDGKRVIGVVMGGRTARARDDRMAALLDAAMPRAGIGRGAAPAAVAQSIDLPERGVPQPVEPRRHDPVARKLAALESRNSDLAYAAPATPAAPIVAAPIVAEPVAMEDAPTVSAPTPRAAIPHHPPADMPFAMASNDGWAVQIAATPSESEAISLLSRAMPTLDRRFNGITPYTQTVGSASGPLHRARFSGFQNRAAAQSACKALTASRFACTVVQGDG